jgi:hypothetical protein
MCLVKDLADLFKVCSVFWRVRLSLAGQLLKDEPMAAVQVICCRTLLCLLSSIRVHLCCRYKISHVEVLMIGDWCTNVCGTIIKPQSGVMHEIHMFNGGPSCMI